MSKPAAGPHLRILHVITGLEVGGAERLLLETIRYQTARGHEVSVCSLRPGGPLEAAAREVCPVLTITMGHALTPQAIWRLARLMKRGKYDVVHSSLYQANLAARVAARLAGVPVSISSVHCSYTWLRWYHFAVDRWTARLGDVVTTVSEAVRRYSLETERLPEAKVLTLLNGIDVSRFDSISDHAATRAEMRAALACSPDALVLCVVGRLHEQKGHTYLFRALERLAPRYPHLRLLIVGDGPERSSLEAECRSRRLDSVVSFLGIRKDIPRLLAASDVFVLPSLYEGLPVVVLEAMAMSCPVVATRVDGTPEVIDDGVHGLLVPPADSLALEQALERLLAYPDVRGTLAAAGRKRVVEDFTFEKMMQKTETLYSTYLNRKAPERFSRPTLETLATGERV